MASSFGKTWWGEQWLNSLKNIDYSNRLPRGASYARKGAVEQISIEGNHIKAKVAGSRARPYKVDIIIPPFLDPELSEFLNDIKQRPVILSKLLNRDLDPQVSELAAKHKLKVFPRQWSDLEMYCSCPDWAVPCKHLASVIYQMSAEIDNNPFRVFELHNVDLPRLMTNAGIMVNDQVYEVPKLNELLFDNTKPVMNFDEQLTYRRPDFSGLEPLFESITALLDPDPAFYISSATGFRKKYFIELKRVVKNSGRLVNAKASLADFQKELQFIDISIIPHTSVHIYLDVSSEAKAITDEDIFSLSSLIRELFEIPVSRINDYQPSVAALHTTARLALQLVAHGAIVPQIVVLADNKYAIRWLPAMMSNKVRELCNELEEMLPPDIITGMYHKKKKPVNMDRAVNLLSSFISELVRITSQNVADDLFAQLFFKGKRYAFQYPGEEALPGGIMSWLQKLYLSQGDVKPVISVEELENTCFRIDINVEIPAAGLKHTITLKELLTNKNFEHRRLQVLKTLALLSNFIWGLDDYINSAGEKEIVMDSDTFASFLMDIVPAIRLLDIPVRLPKALQQILKPKPSIKVKSKNKSSGMLRLDKLLDFDWQVAVGDKLISEKEFSELLQKSEGLIKFKSNYIYVKKEELEKLYKHFSSGKKLSSFQIMRAALTGEYKGAAVSVDKNVKKLLDELTKVDQIALPENIHAQMRPYQHRGYSWIYRNARVGFGSVLADDMGLGKTLQVICALLKFKEEGCFAKQKAIVVAPTGLLTNWMAEIEKFAPALKAFIYHGPNRDIQNIKEHELIITSYGILRSDASLLKKMSWHVMVIDEAQNIKNTTTAQTKAVKSLKAEHFVAMSGTPVENRMSELWSIMDFCNRGLLGSMKDFSETYANPIEQMNDSRVAENLKKVTAPFLMRRLKTDKRIITDLPEKTEIDSFASLTKEQASLYEKTLENALGEIEGIQTNDNKSLFERQGLVLQMIIALKQICNHPAQFLKDGNTDPGLSGKIALLFDKIDSIVESNEKVLLFTQFTEMGKLLEAYIRERYGYSPLYYHGGSSLKQRSEMVERFQSNPADKIFLLSLRAAGTGLNLTAASHVIHYDLWWNPAVETQATDRAYRIGQKKNVMVHRFITKNTFEERINDMIQQKKALAEMTVSTGENWIGNLSDKELHEIFELG